MKKLLLAFSILICLVIFVTITYLVIKSSGAALSVDAYVTDFIVSHRGARFGIIYWLFRTATEFAEPIMIVAIGIMFLLFSKCDNKFVVFLLGLLLAFTINEALKEIIARQRPNVEHFQKESSKSFPSAHSVMSTYVYTSIMYYVSKTKISSKWKSLAYIVCPIIILLVMASRLVMGVHYFSDVVAGAAFGLAITLIMMPIYDFLVKYKFLEGGIIEAFKNRAKKD